MQKTITKLAQSSFMHVFGAFLLMGSWAFYANSMSPMPKPIVAGLIQGTLSAVITLVLKKGIEAIAARLDGVMALLLPTLTASIVSFTLLTSIHTLAGTPEVLWTIALPFTAATFYASSYSLALWKLRGTSHD